MKDLVFPKGRTPNFQPLTESDYRFVARKLVENGSIKTIPDCHQFCPAGHQLSSEE
jgi:hypothetical protein